jgi:hypothetical protein
MEEKLLKRDSRGKHYYVPVIEEEGKSDWAGGIILVELTKREKTRNIRNTTRHYLKYHATNGKAPLIEIQYFLNQLSNIYHVPITELNTYSWGKQLSKLSVFAFESKQYISHDGRRKRMVNYWKLNHYTK